MCIWEFKLHFYSEIFLNDMFFLFLLLFLVLVLGFLGFFWFWGFWGELFLLVFFFVLVFWGFFFTLGVSPSLGLKANMWMWWIYLLYRIRLSKWIISWRTIDCQWFIWAYFLSLRAAIKTSILLFIIMIVSECMSS